jgi:hypothetical protein
MMPKNLKLEDIDEGIRDAVINLNRIPGIDTLNASEGYIYEDNLFTPTRRGQIGFLRNPQAHLDLITKIASLREAFPFSKLDIGELVSFPNGRLLHTICADFEPYQGNGIKPVRSRTYKEIEEYFARARRRKARILEFWKAVSDETADYIYRNINSDLESLPYKESQSFPKKGEADRTFLNMGERI